MGRTVTGRVLVIVGFVALIVTLLPFAFALVIAAATASSSGYAMVPFLALVALLWPVAVAALAVAAVLGIIGVILGGYRALGFIAAIGGAVLAIALTVWMLL